MNERKKLAEVHYFYSRMVEENNNRESFKYNLSAFLSSARSVLQYAFKEINNRQIGQSWYDNRIANSSIFRYFRDKRDFNIHSEPINPRAVYKIHARENIHISDSISITLKDKNGNIIDKKNNSNKSDKDKKPESSVSSKTIYKFDDWQRNEDIISLSQRYVGELENFVNDGIRQNFISG